MPLSLTALQARMTDEKRARRARAMLEMHELPDVTGDADAVRDDAPLISGKAPSAQPKDMSGGACIAEPSCRAARKQIYLPPRCKYVAGSRSAVDMKALQLQQQLCDEWHRRCCHTQSKPRVHATHQRPIFWSRVPETPRRRPQSAPP